MEKYNTSPNLLEQMKKDVLARVPAPASSILNSGFKRIPSVSSFEIQINQENTILKQVGIPRKLKPKIEWTLTQSNRMNDYIKYQIRRLTKARDENKTELYWKIAQSLVKRSISFRTAAFQRVYPGWWHEMSLTALIGLNKEINRIIQERDSNLRYHRVYIEKEGTDTYRPLGCPEEPWRVVMHMWSNFLTIFVRKHLESFNHGFLPGRGTTSAWKDIISKVLNSKYVYEFDLKQFFPSVNLKTVEEKLLELGVTKEVTSYIMNVNRNFPKLPKEEKLDESMYKDKISATYQGLLDLGDIGVEIANEEGYEDLWEYAKAQTERLEELAPQLLSPSQSLPQGLNTSPILSIITLIDWNQILKDRGINLLMYADDGIMYSQKPFDPYFMPHLTENKEKSGWVKQAAWSKDLKFLGIIYNHQTDLIEGSTKKGSTLKFGLKQENVFNLIKDLRGDIYPERLTYLVKTGLLNIVQAKLYQGSWTEIPSRKVQGWETNPKSWWAHKEAMKGDKLLSSEAVHSLAKVINAIIRRLPTWKLRQCAKRMASKS